MSKAEELSSQSSGPSVHGRCGSHGACVETVRSGDTYYILDTKDYSSGPVAVLSEEEYADRYQKAREENDPTRMFNSPEIATDTFREDELRFYGACLLDAFGVLANLEEHQPYVASEEAMISLQAAVALKEALPA